MQEFPGLRLRTDCSCLDKIDRLPWLSGEAVSVYGLRVGVQATDPAAIGWMLDRLPAPRSPAADDEPVDRLYSLYVGGPDDGAGITRQHRLYEDWTATRRSIDLEPVLEKLEWYARVYVAENAEDRIFVHAGVVAWEGEAILLPGTSMSGKTTLTGELARIGASYFSDEYAVLDDEGLVHPFPKPLSVREEGSTEQREVDPGVYGTKQATEPLPVGLVVVGSYEEGGTWQPEPMTPGQGTLELLKHAPAARRKPDRVLAALEKVASRARILVGARGEAAEAAPSIIRTLETSVRAL